MRVREKRRAEDVSYLENHTVLLTVFRNICPGHEGVQINLTFERGVVSRIQI